MRDAKKSPGPHLKSKQVNGLDEKISSLVPASPRQIELFHVEKQVELNGVEMGVLENGVPYLSERGLARMCGIDARGLNRLAVDWAEEKTKERGAAIKEMLEKSGYFEDGLFLRSELNGTPVNAYTEPVCMAVLEYYAFVSKDRREEAISAFRALARSTFRAFIYQAVGYSPDQKVLDSWRHFHDRVDMVLDAVPFGYFSVFREIASMIVPMIRAGIMISDRVVPDISVGKTWSSYWEQNGLAARFGERTRYDHEYPLYYPQAKSNPQPSFAYPDAALGEFRAWLRQQYVTNKFPEYLLRQTKLGNLPEYIANRAIESFTPKKLSAGDQTKK
jgi:hypothetical protein